jgi:hypothetical protein
VHEREASPPAALLSRTFYAANFPCDVVVERIRRCQDG